ncbi:hypothetical protein GCM10023175_05910 [Pseudonocardia xishanensis]|uniref:Integral membrane protein n=1 Tax=Pseudonocardia xishanensis TaxID=630995 RepID=A0ABP8RGB0_9PSEU
MAVLLCALGVVVLVVAALLGVMAHGSVTARASAQSVDRVRVTATITRVVGPTVPAAPSGPGGRRVLADWTAPDGTPRTGEVTTPVSAAPGSVVPLWVDRAGAAVRAPVSPRSAPLVGAVVGIGIALLGAALLLVVWRVVRRVAAGRNAEAWARGWAEVEPTWSGRTNAT